MTQQNRDASKKRFEKLKSFLKQVLNTDVEFNDKWKATIFGRELDQAEFSLG
jgi:hypothetical protein